MRLFGQIFLIISGGLLGLYTLFLAARTNFNLGVILPGLIGLPLFLSGIFFSNLLNAVSPGFWYILRLLLAAGYSLALAVFIIACALIWGQLSRGPEPEPDALVVLGAALYGDRVSATLAFRLDTAFNYWQEHPDLTIVVCGGQGPDELIPEAEAMAAYLIRRGVPAEKILQEAQSTSTRENLSFAREHLLENSAASGGQTDETELAIIVITSNYHLYRAVKIAEQTGFTASGIGAPTLWYLLPADLIFEMEVEGGITRLMAVFPTAAAIPEELGSIRSARHSYVDLACGLDALLVHVGGSFIALDKIRDENITTIDMQKIGAPFWRDQEWMDRRGYAHSVKTSGELLGRTIETRSIATELENPLPVFSFRHPQEFVPADGPPALYAHVPFSRHTQAEFFYDAAAGEYSKHQFGQPHLDMATGRAVSFTNVILLQTEVKVINNKGHINADLTGGSGYYLAGGHFQEISWEKGGTYEPLRLYAADNIPLVINCGKSYIGIISDSRTITLAEEKEEN